MNKLKKVLLCVSFTFILLCNNTIAKNIDTQDNICFCDSLKSILNNGIEVRSPLNESVCFIKNISEDGTRYYMKLSSLSDTSLSGLKKINFLFYWSDIGSYGNINYNQEKVQIDSYFDSTTLKFTNIAFIEIKHTEMVLFSTYPIYNFAFGSNENALLKKESELYRKYAHCLLTW